MGAYIQLTFIHVATMWFLLLNAQSRHVVALVSACSPTSVFEAVIHYWGGLHISISFPIPTKVPDISVPAVVT